MQGQEGPQGQRSSSPEGAGRPCRVALVGPRATGKSSVGKRLAELSGLRFCDLDELLTQRQGGLGAAAQALQEGSGAGDLLRDLGEERFRDLEQEALEAIEVDTTGSEGVVLACGGGVLLRAANRSRLAHSWTVVYLRTPAVELRRRLEAGAESAKRPPLLTGSSSAAAEIEAVLEARESSYVSASDFIVECLSDDIESVAQRVLELCPRPPRSTNLHTPGNGSS